MLVHTANPLVVCKTSSRDLCCAHQAGVTSLSKGFACRVHPGLHPPKPLTCNMQKKMLPFLNFHCLAGCPGGRYNPPDMPATCRDCEKSHFCTGGKYTGTPGEHVCVVSICGMQKQM